MSSDDKDLEKPGYNLVREDHPSNTKRGGVCGYYKSSLSFRVINVFIWIKNKKEILQI